MKITLVLLVVAAIAVIFFIMKRKVVEKKEDEAPKKNGIIYGSDTCRYTILQKKKYPDFEYVDCTKDTCPDFVKAFPTTVYPDGSTVPGYAP
jgi:hypothetical protein